MRWRALLVRGLWRTKLLSSIQGTVVVANISLPNQTVVSGDVRPLTRVSATAASRSIFCRRLPVSNAFHSPLVAEAASAFEQRRCIRCHRFRRQVCRCHFRH